MQLLNKYNVPVPRYTSYPTVPHWQDEIPANEDYLQRLNASLQADGNLSLYIHLPYCEQLCTYCGCNKRITKNHAVERPYLDSILKEWELYRSQITTDVQLRELHFGGGTPTFFSAENLDYLLKNLFKTIKKADKVAFSFEAHPATTTTTHLLTLRQHGFDRISIGVQDFAKSIMELINRRQSVLDVIRVTKAAKALGYSINYDLIYGLPKQKLAHIKENFRRVAALRPDRIAFYSYAHVPNFSPSQRAYSVEDLPQGKEKQALQDLGEQLLLDLGYKNIGLDHFALSTDALYQAQRAGKLHRNFMGYTPCQTRVSIGLGTSAISDTQTAYVQNVKRVEAYQDIIEKGQLPFFRGHLLSKDEQIIRHHITQLMCNFKTDWMDEEMRSDTFYAAFDRLDELEKDGLIERRPFELRVTELGKPFIRNICAALDPLYNNESLANTFSRAV
ncbi:MAG: oxygen-independent coproporphyrinogen III oxidase [Saprospiraceae bacterium]